MLIHSIRSARVKDFGISVAHAVGGEQASLVHRPDWLTHLWLVVVNGTAPAIEVDYMKGLPRHVWVELPPGSVLPAVGDIVSKTVWKGVLGPSKRSTEGTGDAKYVRYTFARVAKRPGLHEARMVLVESTSRRVRVRSMVTVAVLPAAPKLPSGWLTTDMVAFVTRYGGASRDPANRLATLVRNFSQLGKLLTYRPTPIEDYDETTLGVAGLSRLPVAAVFHLANQPAANGKPLLLDCINFAAVVERSARCLGVEPVVRQVSGVELTRVKGVGGRWGDLNDFAIHQLVQLDGKLYDGALVLDADAKPTSSPQEPLYVTGLTYERYLTQLDARVSDGTKSWRSFRWSTVPTDPYWTGTLHLASPHETCAAFAARLATLRSNPAAKLVTWLMKVQPGTFLRPVLAVVEPKAPQGKDRRLAMFIAYRGGVIAVLPTSRKGGPPYSAAPTTVWVVEADDDDDQELPMLPPL